MHWHILSNIKNDMKKTLMILMSIMVLNISAQTEEKCHQWAKDNIIKKIKKHTPTNLLPYSDDNGMTWGLLDIKSRKRVIAPIFKHFVVFNPFLIFNKEGCEQRIKIDNYYNVYTSYGDEKIGFLQEGYDYTDELGFKVDEKGKMLSYSKSYKKSELDRENISNPIKINEKYYAIIYADDRHYLINSKGEEQGLSFKELKAFYHKDDNGEFLFSYIDDHNVNGLITLSGRKIMEGELLSPPISDWYDFEYSIQANHTHSGVLDLSTLQWVIKPQTKFHIYKVIYTSKKYIGFPHSGSRSDVNIYFLAKKGEKHFVIMSNGEQILPYIIGKTKYPKM